MKETRFKQTEIGLIPEDWKIISLEEIGEPKMCKRILKNQTFIKGDIPFYKIGTFGGKADAYISKSLYEYYKKKFSFPQKGDVLISAAGTIGRLVIYQGEDAYYQDSNIVWIDNKEEKLLNQYLYYTLKNTSWDTSQGTIQRLYNASLKAKQIIIPLSINEQKKIASALTSIDNLLLSLDKLIEKKRLIKQGAMQELLTGKKRLPGFTGEWIEMKLGKLCDIFGRIGFRGYTKADLVKEGNGAISFSPSDINSNKINYNTCTYISYFKYEESPEIQVFNGDIIFCKTASIGKCALVENLNEKATINPQFVVMKNFNCDNRYLYYRLIDESFQTKIKKIAGGSTIPTMSQEKLKEETFVMPENVKEQKAISRILANMDKEIESIEGKKAKYERIKQGMMQQLLTGKIRLI